MAVAPTSLGLPRDTCRFTFYNEGEDRLNSSAGAYQLFVSTGDTWEFIVPKVGSGGAQPIEIGPGETREWVLHVNTADLGSVTPPSGNDDRQSFLFRFPPGTYAFGFRVTPANSETARVYTTKFTVSGETPPLVPSDSVVSHSRQGSTLTVKTQTKKEYDHSRRVSLLLTRRSPTKRTADLSLFELYNPLYEQVSSYESVFVPPLLTELLRDGFAFVKSSDEQVRIHTVDTVRPPLGMGEDESLSVTYAGNSWKLTTQDGWE